LLVGVVVTVVVLIVGVVVAIALVGSHHHDDNATAPLYTGDTATTQPVDTTTTLQGVAAPSVPDGYQLIASSLNGYAFVVPSDWLALKLGKGELQQQIAKLEQTDPAEAEEIQQLAQSLPQNGPGGAGPLAFAINQTAQGAGATAILVGISGTAVTPTELLAELSFALPAENGKLLSQAAVTVSGDQGIKAVVQVKRAIPTGGTITVTETLLIVQSSRGVYMLTVASAQPDVTKTIIHSLRVR
jgi:hypothetical protein